MTLDDHDAKRYWVLLAFDEIGRVFACPKCWRQRITVRYTSTAQLPDRCPSCSGDLEAPTSVQPPPGFGFC